MTVKPLYAPLTLRLPDLAATLGTLQFWRHRARERRRLLELDERLLRDIGLSRADARREAAKPFWMA